MSQEFADFSLWQALSLAQPDEANAVFKISSTQAGILLDYCTLKSLDKKRTDVTGVQSDVDVHPDTGPAGFFVELQIIVDRKSVNPEILKTLIRWYGTQNTNSDFNRGFLGLENDDNPDLDLVPAANLGYKIIRAAQIDPIDFKSRQIYQIVLQLGGKALNLPVFP